MNTRKLWMLCAIAITAVTTTVQDAVAVEPLSAKELAVHCAAYENAMETADAQFCIRYIQGFIDGAIATDVKVMLNMQSEYGAAETFTERVMRTRSPSRSSSDRAARFAEYCLGETTPLLEIVNNVVMDLRNQEVGEGILARNAVYEALRAHYPCVSSAGKK